MSHYRQLAQLRSNLATLRLQYGDCPADATVLVSMLALQKLIRAMELQQIEV